jgi:catechol 2,3-dioxygenase-like lactoylglutathione lyase family enzyme
VIESAYYEASVRFYREGLGFPLEAGKNDAGNDRWLAGDHAETTWKEWGYFHFAIYRAKTSTFTTGLQLGITSPDLAALHARLEEQEVRVVHDPRPEPWGLTARYTDPDGNTVSVTELRR